MVRTKNLLIHTQEQVRRKQAQETKPKETAEEARQKLLNAIFEDIQAITTAIAKTTSSLKTLRRSLSCLSSKISPMEVPMPLPDSSEEDE